MRRPFDGVPAVMGTRDHGLLAGRQQFQFAYLDFRLIGGWVLVENRVDRLVAGSHGGADTN
jgi:hypothetical protein